MTSREFNNICKETVIAALKSKYGFAPCKSNITLLEAHSDRTYIMFSVCGKEYQFNSYHMYGKDGEDWGVWCGAETVSRYER